MQVKDVADHPKRTAAIDYVDAWERSTTRILRSDFDSLTRRRIGDLLKLVRPLKTWIRKLEEYAFYELKSHRKIPGWKLVDKRPMRSWRNQETAARVLEKYVSRDELFELKMKSPAQVEKLLGASWKHVLDDLVVKKSNGLTIAPEEDKRPARVAHPREPDDVPF